MENILAPVSVVIPTYNREEVLVSTVNQLLALKHPGNEIILVDQSLNHTDKTNQALATMQNTNKIVWMRDAKPSIPKAMNTGLKHSKNEIVLYLDDDIELVSELILEHARIYSDNKVTAVAGRVVQPWEQMAPSENSFREDNDEDPDAFLFNSKNEIQIERFMAGNVSFRKSSLLESGGFDENFVKVAYRFEAECAARFINTGNTIQYNPDAVIKHLKVTAGGTRSFGEHLKTIKPGHSVGRYYYHLVTKNQKHRWLNFFTYPFRSVVTRFHLKNPWWIPVTFLAEVSGMIWATCLKLKGRKLIASTWQKN